MRPFTILACSLVFATPLTAAEKSSPVGKTVANFTLRDFRGKTHSLADFDGKKFVVVAFLGTECPLAKLYMPRLAKLAADYDSKDVAFVGVNANRQDSITEIAAHARIHKLPFPVLKDLGNKVADAMAAKRTPEVFVLDAKRVVRYWGRIDDQYGVGYIREEPKRQDLKLALDELLAGKPVTTASAESVGCYIGRVTKADANAKVTYSNQVARILQKRCVECHRSGEIAPFSLTKYEEVAGWADTIAEVVADRRMPPWHADPKYGHFSNDRSMTATEKQTLFAWVKAGAPEGDPADLPQPRKWQTGWQLPRQPDQVVAMRSAPYTVPAEGEFSRKGRKGVRYKYFTVDPGFKQDKWVQAAEVIPGNRAVVHHILVLVRTPSGRSRSGAGGGEYLVGYVPGLRPRPYPSGTAKFVPAGSKLVFQVHYTPNGSVQKDQSKVGLVFAKPDEVRYAAVTSMAANPRIRIPANAGNHREQATSGSLPIEVQLISFMPHMHLRGKSFSYEAVFPDGKRTTLLNVPQYDFNWQTAYVLQEPLKMPPGTRIHCVAHFDNSEDNLANPDPNETVRWGDQTWNEMLIGYFDILVPAKYLTSGKRANPRPQVGGDSKSRAAQVVAQFDKDKDGQLSRSELPARFRLLFGRVDADKSGKLSVGELTKLFDQLRRR